VSQFEIHPLTLVPCIRAETLPASRVWVGYNGAMPESHITDCRPGTVAQALQQCSAALESAGLYFGHGTDNVRDEAVQLVLAVAGLPPDAGEDVLANPLNEQQVDCLQALLRRRIEQRRPLPYLLGRAWFAGLEFHCDERAIIPRSPLAELLPRAFEPWYSGPAPRRILDLCCGGGCIGLAAAVYLPDVHVDLVDNDSAALDLTAQNAALHGLQGRVEILCSDLMSAVQGRRYDLILCNPPYVNAADLAAMPAEFHSEPRVALYISLILARRLNAVNHLLVEARHRETQAEQRRGRLGELLERMAHAMHLRAPR